VEDQVCGTVIFIVEVVSIKFLINYQKKRKENLDFMRKQKLANPEQIEEKIQAIQSQWGKSQKNNIDSLYKIWGLKLRRKRIKLNLTQSEVGQMYGLSPQQIEKFENGVNKVSFDKLIIFCEKTGTGYNYFLDTLNGKTITNGGSNE
tara:strand:- start:1424 stop:1864 length:441 start_codon:yes stop_codon:yes gene_type:complete